MPSRSVHWWPVAVPIDFDVGVIDRQHAGAARQSARPCRSVSDPVSFHRLFGARADVTANDPGCVADDTA